MDGPKPAAEAGGILGALQLALAKRDTAIHSSGGIVDSCEDFNLTSLINCSLILNDNKE